MAREGRQGAQRGGLAARLSSDWQPQHVLSVGSKFALEDYLRGSSRDLRCGAALLQGTGLQASVEGL